MSSFPKNTALEAAIVTDADDDTPRLVYADWLDENGDPDHAEFIRVQCRLADLSPAEPEWVDLKEREAELAVLLVYRFQKLVPPDLSRFYFGTNIVASDEEPFRRGFPYFIACQMTGNQWNSKSTRSVAVGLTRLMQTTTIRGIEFYSITPERLTEFLALPALRQLSGFAFSLDLRSAVSSGEFYERLAHSPVMKSVRHLDLHDGLATVDSEPLATAEYFQSLSRRTIRSPMNHSHILKSSWSQQLTWLQLPKRAGRIVRIGDMPRLHTLEVRDFVHTFFDHNKELLALGRLNYDGPMDPLIAGKLAKVKLPRMAVFEASRKKMTNPTFQTLLQADWFAGLRSLDLTSNSIGDKGIVALADRLEGSALRVLRLGDNNFGSTGLTALARDKVFPMLITLSLDSSLKRKATEADMGAFLSALTISSLRCLNLDNWPLEDRGAIALASNPALASLKRLFLDTCNIGDVGAKARLSSPYLQNLVDLHLSDNRIATGADALADPGVMPRLGVCWMSGNKIPMKSQERIEKRRMYTIL